MSLQTVPLLSFDFFPSRPVQVEVSTAPLSSDAGLLPVRQFDERIRLTEQFAAALQDRRHPTFTQQSLLSMVRQRIFGILADYEDQNDHDTLRSDPVFKLIADRLPGDPEKAKGTSLNSASLTPKPLASSVYVHVPEAPSSVKRLISVMSLFPSLFFPPRLISVMSLFPSPVLLPSIYYLFHVFKGHTFLLGRASSDGPR